MLNTIALVVLGSCIVLAVSTNAAFAAEGLLPASVTAKDFSSVSTRAAAVAPALFEGESPESEQYNFLQQQIYSGETESAANQLETVVAQIEAGYNRYHEDLVIPLALLGDSLLLQQKYDAALDMYDRAQHIARVSYGLFDTRQLAVVYREADAYRKLGDLESSSRREEYAFEVMNRNFDANDPKLLPGLQRLGDFYLATYNYLSARSLYQRALRIHTQNNTNDSLEAIRTLQGIARTHRLERFPPVYVANPEDNRLQGPIPGLTTSDLDGQHVGFNNFPAGEAALKQIVSIRQQQEPEDVAATMEAFIELADWFLMFGHTNEANTLYAHVYENMLANQQDAAVFFAKPKLIYLPKPHDPRPPTATGQVQRVEGRVTLGFNVATSGRVRKLTTLESIPPKLMDFRVRRSVRQAVFRPSLLEGVPVAADSQTYTYAFDYFPELEPISEQSSVPASAPTNTTVDEGGPGNVPSAKTIEATPSEETAEI